MNGDPLRISDATVNQVIRDHPESIEVFNRFHVDASCGGSDPLDVAAINAGVEPSLLLKELLAVLESST